MNKSKTLGIGGRNISIVKKKKKKKKVVKYLDNLRHFFSVMTAWSWSSQNEAEPLPQPALFVRQDVSVVHKVHGKPALHDNA